MKLLTVAAVLLLMACANTGGLGPYQYYYDVPCDYMDMLTKLPQGAIWECRVYIGNACSCVPVSWG